MGFFFNSADLGVASYAGLLIYTFALVGIGEFARRSLATSVFTYIIVPIFLVFIVWPMSMDTSVMQWFVIAKLIAILVFAWVIMGLRFSTKLQNLKWFKYLVPLMLIVNIMEAVSRDFEISQITNGVYNDVFIQGGGWNIANGIAGIINIILISGITAIYISKDKSKTMVWPDMTIWWILAYDIWNFAFIYNNAEDRAFIMISALFAANIATHCFRRGAWMQHRVYTLSLNMMFFLTLPEMFLNSDISVQASRNPAAHWTLSLLSLGANVALLVYQIWIMKTKKRNSITGEVYYDTKEYKKTVEEDKIRENLEISSF
ncbi:MAG: DUF5692 family protein [Mycoplasmatales bacterium]